MLSGYERLKDELSALYPDVTDAELTEMTNNLIDFYTTAVKAVLEAPKAKTPLNEINDS